MLETAFVPTRIPGLDNLLGGGFRPKTTILLRGARGSGKTTLALQILDNMMYDDSKYELGLYVSFELDRDGVDELVTYMDTTFGTKLKTPPDRKRLLWLSHEALGPAYSTAATPTGEPEQVLRDLLAPYVNAVNKEVKKLNKASKPKIVVFDSLNALCSHILQKAPNILTIMGSMRQLCLALTEEIRNALRNDKSNPLAQTIILFTGEFDPNAPGQESLFGESYLCDTEIILTQEEIPLCAHAPNTPHPGPLQKRFFCRVPKARRLPRQERRCSYDFVQNQGVVFYETYPGDGHVVLFHENQSMFDEWMVFQNRDIPILYPTLSFEVFDRSGLQRTFASQRQLRSMPRRLDMYLTSFDTYWVNWYAELCQRWDIAALIKKTLGNLPCTRGDTKTLQEASSRIKGKVHCLCTQKFDELARADFLALRRELLDRSASSPQCNPSFGHHREQGVPIATLDLHISHDNLCRLIGKIIDAIYGMSGYVDATLTIADGNGTPTPFLMKCTSQNDIKAQVNTHLQTKHGLVRLVEFGHSTGGSINLSELSFYEAESAIRRAVEEGRYQPAAGEVWTLALGRDSNDDLQALINNMFRLDKDSARDNGPEYCIASVQELQRQIVWNETLIEEEVNGFAEICTDAHCEASWEECKFKLSRLILETLKSFDPSGLLKPLDEGRLRLYGERRSPIISELEKPLDEHAGPIFRPFGIPHSSELLAVPYNANVGMLVVNQDVFGAVTQHLRTTLPEGSSAEKTGALVKMLKTEYDKLRPGHNSDAPGLNAVLTERAQALLLGEFPETWEEVLVLCDMFKQYAETEGSSYRAFPFLIETKTFDTFMATFLEVLWNCGGDLQIQPDYDIKDLDSNRQHLLHAFSILNRLFAKGYIPQDSSLEIDYWVERRKADPLHSSWLFARHWYSTFVETLVHKNGSTGEYSIKTDTLGKRLNVIKLPITIDYLLKQRAPKSERKVRHHSCRGEWYFAVLNGTENEALAEDIINNLMSSQKIIDRAFRCAAVPTVQAFYDMYGESKCFDGVSRPGDLVLPSLTWNGLKTDFLAEAKSRTAVFDYRHCIREFQSILEYIRGSAQETDAFLKQIANRLESAITHIQELGSKPVLEK